MERLQRGFFARLRLESAGPEAGVLPHERTLSGPKEDRYKLLRATGVNTSPATPSSTTCPVRGRAPGRRGRRAARHRPRRTMKACAIGCGPAGVRRRSGERRRRPARQRRCRSGHHRRRPSPHETALRYRDERHDALARRTHRSTTSALMLEATAQELTVLPTHRLRRIRSEGARIPPARASYSR